MWNEFIFKIVARKYFFIDKIFATVINTSFKCRNKEQISLLFPFNEYQLCVINCWDFIQKHFLTRETCIKLVPLNEVIKDIIKRWVLDML